MDFITRQDSLEETERMYGKKSGQYAIHKVLTEAEKELRDTGSLWLGKMCKNEFIWISIAAPYYHVTNVIKKYTDVEKTKVKKKKEKEVAIPIHQYVMNDVYDLVFKNGYQILDKEKDL